MFSQFSSISKSSIVAGELTPKEFLKLVKSPGKYKEQIVLSKIFRQYGDLALYRTIKKSKIPAFTLNCSFYKRRRNNDIKNFSGFIYIDIDGTTSIDLSHPLIYASWISLSGLGRGVLVKTAGVNKENFKRTYVEIGQELNVEVDCNAAKMTQLTVLPHDPNVYIYEDSIEYSGKDFEKVLHSPYIKKKPIIGTVAPIEQEQNLRFNNVSEFVATLNFNGEAAILFENEVELSEVKIPSPIPEGKRNSTLTGICYQIRALNPQVSYSILSKLLFWINHKHCNPPYPQAALNQLVQTIHNLPLEELIPKKNLKRRVFYNPDYDLSAKEKRSLSRHLLNQERTEITINKIKEALASWDLKKHKKITKKAISEDAKVSVSSIKKYYHLFESEIENLKKAINKPP